jgi:ankyrin repeat protein
MGAPLDHVNNLGWTGANVTLADRHGHTPLSLARAPGHTAMGRLLEGAGAR